MAVQYPSGVQGKQYEIIGNYSNGINRNISDTTIPGNYFRELTNFFPDKEGTLSKRNGLYDSKLDYFFDKIINKEYSDNVLVDIVAYDRYNANHDEYETEFNPDYVLSSEGHLKRFNDLVFKGEKVYNNVVDTSTFEGYTTNNKLYAQPKEVLFMEVVDNDGFLEVLQDKIDDLFNGQPFGIASLKPITFEFIVAQRAEIGYNQLTGNGEIDDSLTFKLTSNGLFLYHIRVEISTSMYIMTDEGMKYYDVAFKIVIDEMSSFDDYNFYSDYGYEIIWKFDLDKTLKYGAESTKFDTMNFEKYNGYYYAATGTNFLIKMKEKFSDDDINWKEFLPRTTIDQIGSRNNGYWNVYKPVPLEAMNIGFNILAPNTMEYIDNQGNVQMVKGIFYSVDVSGTDGNTLREPTKSIPYNSPFYINVIYTGDTAPNKPQYRPDNGEVDTTLNPYKELSGAYTSTEGGIAVFKCDGINDANNIELKVDLVETPFIAYATMGTANVPEIGRVSEINNLVLSSTHCKVIGNQLVLFGGHGYIFFSDYENFEYFPNYYYVYVAESELEEVKSINYFRQYYAVFTNKRIKRMTGTFGSSDFGIYPLNDAIGCNISRSVKQVNNNLYFIGNDGLYMLKQGYLGEGTENVEKLDKNINEVLNYLNVLQCFVLGQYYVILLNDGKTMYIYDTDHKSFYEYQFASKYEQETYLEDVEGYENYNYFYSFQSQLYDANGNYLLVPEYDFLSHNIEQKRGVMSLRIFRFSDLDFLDVSKRTTDSREFVSTLETPYINMGYPTNTKKFKTLFVKYSNASGAKIPLYITVMIDGYVVVSPEHYEIVYDEATETYFYQYVVEANKDLISMGHLGTLELGEKALGGKTSFQLKLKINDKGRNIKIILTDGYDKKIGYNNYEYHRNSNNFTIESMGIIYKLKKVKEG